MFFEWFWGRFWCLFKMWSSQHLPFKTIHAFHPWTAGRRVSWAHVAGGVFQAVSRAD